MENKNKKIVKILGFIILILVLFLVIRHKNIEKKNAENFKNQLKTRALVTTNEEDKFRGFKLKGIKNSKTQWELDGKLAILMIKNSDEIFLEKPFMHIFSDDLKETANIKADTSTINSKTKFMHSVGNVVMYSIKDDSTLYTDQVFYDDRKQLFYSNDKVKIIRPDSVTTGEGFDANIDLTEINIRKNVEIKYEKKDEKDANTKV